MSRTWTAVVPTFLPLNYIYCRHQYCADYLDSYLESWELQLRKCPQKIGLQASQALFLISDWCARAQPIVGSANPGAGGSGCYKKAEWASHEGQANEQHPSMAFLHQLLPPHSYHGVFLCWLPTIDCNSGYVSQINLFACGLLCLWCFITAVETLRNKDRDKGRPLCPLQCIPVTQGIDENRKADAQLKHHSRQRRRKGEFRDGKVWEESLKGRLRGNHRNRLPPKKLPHHLGSLENSSDG